MHSTVPSTAWRELVSRLVKSEMTKRKLRYDDLSQRLAQYGVSQSADNLRNKINRGIMGADLLLQLVYVLDIRSLDKTVLGEILQSIDSSAGA